MKNNISTNNKNLQYLCSKYYEGLLSLEEIKHAIRRAKWQAVVSHCKAMEALNKSYKNLLSVMEVNV